MDKLDPTMQWLVQLPFAGFFLYHLHYMVNVKFDYQYHIMLNIVIGELIRTLFALVKVILSEVLLETVPVT